MPTNLDPRIGTDAVSQRLDSLIFSSLVELDAQRIPRGDLAEKWETPDPVTYIFHLRGGVKFHDRRQLTSADVKYTFDSILDRTITSPKRGSLALIQSIDAPDAATVIFHLKEPYAGFLWEIARPAIGIVPAGSGTDFSTRLTGTGPFRFVSAEQDDNVILDCNSDYFDGAPKISRVRFRVVPEAIVRALELRKGSADVEVNSLTSDMIPVLRQQPTLDITDNPGTNYQYLAFNLENATLAKREVRQALAYATNRDEIIKFLYRGQARPADGPLPNSSWAYDPDIRKYGYDPQQAEQLLDAAGFPRHAAMGGMRVRLSLKTTTEESSRLLATVLQEQWRKVGIDLDVRPLEFATLYSDMARGSFEIFTLRWIGANNDPDTFFEYVFDSRKAPPAGANRGHYRNPEVDALLDQARVEGDREKRRAIFSRVQKIVAEDLPYVSLWFMDNVSVHRKRISGVQLSPTGDYDFLRMIEAR
ncbi:MAG TPA: ABC transporter substrate-binding protein [Candidatus Saccharimonadales bacterium]|nr:ABC transporter substrate-binding protein [Candidatus Saccharimonadales bacterium]